MGLLPASRTTPSPPFYVTGIDFAGPLQIKLGHTRRPVIRKAYVCAFICFATKAVHFEPCSDLSTLEFMAALSRFRARRGTPKHIHSDNGTNFQGSRNEIKELQKLMTSTDTQEALSHFDPASNVQWHFIPPRAPHFGGLWEAGVKVLLKKIVGPHILTFQELNTVLTEAEATLNSRPLTPLSSTDVDDDLALTAGHFLIRRPLKAPTTEDCDPSCKISTLRRWNLVQRLQQDLWVTWSTRIFPVSAFTKPMESYHIQFPSRRAGPSHESFGHSQETTVSSGRWRCVAKGRSTKDQLTDWSS